MGSEMCIRDSPDPTPRFDRPVPASRTRIPRQDQPTSNLSYEGQPFDCPSDPIRSLPGIERNTMIMVESALLPVVIVYDRSREYSFLNSSLCSEHRTKQSRVRSGETPQHTTRYTIPNKRAYQGFDRWLRCAKLPLLSRDLHGYLCPSV